MALPQLTDLADKIPAPWRERLWSAGRVIEQTASRFGPLLLVAFALFYYAQYYRSGLNLGGEGGTVGVVAMRLMEGQKPIADTFLGYNLMWFYPVVWLFELTGPNYIALRIFFFVLCTISATLGFLVVRRATGCGALSLLVGCLLVGIPGMIFRNYMPLLGVLNMYALLQAFVFAQKSNRVRLVWMFASGAALGLTFLIRVDLGLFFSVMFMGLACLYPLGFGGEWKLRLRTVAVGILLAVCTVFLMHLPVYLDAKERGFAENFTGQYSNWFGMMRQEFLWRLLPHSRPASGKSAVAPVIKKEEEPSEKPDKAAKPDKSVLQRAAITNAPGKTPFLGGIFVIITYLPIVVSIVVGVGAAGALGVSLLRRREDLWMPSLAVLTSLGAALTLFPQFFFFRPDTPHLSEMMVPFLVALAIAAWQAGRLCLISRSLPLRILCVLVVVLTVLNGTLYVVHATRKESAGTSAANRGRTQELVAENGVRVLLKDWERDQLQGLHDSIMKNSTPADYVVCYPYAPTVNFMTNRRSFEHNLYVDNATAPRDFHERWLANVKQYDPAVIVIDNRAINKTESSRFANWASKTYDYIKSHYRYDGTYFQQEVYVRPDKSQ